jgi:hypothetical protein
MEVIELHLAKQNILIDTPCGLYYECITIVIDAPSVISKRCSKLERHLLTIVIDDAS